VYAIGGSVFNDINNDGIRQTGEGGMAGVQVKLLDASGAIINTKITNSSGKYLFDDLNAGSYKVSFPLAGATWSVKGAGSDRSMDSDVDPVTNLTDTLVIEPTNTALRAPIAADGTIRATKVLPSIDAGRSVSVVAGATTCLVPT
jgi:hypothetical protein